MRISIHALREERDNKVLQPDLVKVISIHALREERDCRQKGWSRRYVVFQSTRSARSATGSCRCRPNPTGISIHALREERDVLS